MKTLAFLIAISLVIAGIVWAIRKSQAEANLARRKSIERRRKQKEKEALTPQEDMVWPVIIRPVKGRQASGTGSKLDERETDRVIEEPSMTAVKFVPSQHINT